MLSTAVLHATPRAKLVIDMKLNRLIKHLSKENIPEYLT